MSPYFTIVEPDGVQIGLAGTGEVASSAGALRTRSHTHTHHYPWKPPLTAVGELAHAIHLCGELCVVC
jgi:hypothetical protein